MQTARYLQPSVNMICLHNCLSLKTCIFTIKRYILIIPVHYALLLLSYILYLNLQPEELLEIVFFLHRLFE
jgi:hypothetical protein